MEKRTKLDIIESIYEKNSSDITKEEISQIVDSFLNEIKVTLESGKIIEFRRFGTFELRKRSGRDKAHNPRTGAVVSVAPHYVAAFRAGQDLKKKLWNLTIEENSEDSNNK